MTSFLCFKSWLNLPPNHSNNCPMPRLFLVAVIRPLSMSFSFDVSGKVSLAAYLACYLFLLSSSLWLLICSPSSEPHKHTSAHISCHALVVVDGWLWSVEVKHGDVRHRSVGGHWRANWGLTHWAQSGYTGFSITLRTHWGNWCDNLSF